MRVLEAGDWSLVLPEEWSAERDEDVIVIGDRDGVGTIEISEFRKEAGAFDDADLPEFLDSLLDWKDTELGNFHGAASTLEEDGFAMRDWCVYAGDVLLYITYSCDVANRGMDDAAVDDLLSTLRYAAE